MATEANRLRVLQDPALDGPTNMARDEALLQRVGSGDSPPTLRLYQWSSPTISLGYFQRFAEFEKLGARLRELAVVRRPTGGGAILHDIELTYSLSLPMADPLVRENPRRLYELAHAAAIESLAELGIAAEHSGCTDDSGPARGPFFCFARRHEADLLVGNDKIAGSAQRRTRHAVLQHGSIILGSRFVEHPTALAAVAFESSTEVMRARFPMHWAEQTRRSCTTGAWSEEELALATTLIAKYTSDEWNRRV